MSPQSKAAAIQGGSNLRQVRERAGSLLGLLALLHIWRAIAEWPRPTKDSWFALEMAVTIVLPALLSFWAWKLLRNAIVKRGDGN